MFAGRRPASVLRAQGAGLVLTLIRIVALLARFQATQPCDVDDSALDNVRDTGAESVGISCGVDDAAEFILVGPDFIGDYVSLRSDG